MSETVSVGETIGAEPEPGFRVVRTFHPTLAVPDLGEADRFFERVFGATIIASYNPEYESCLVIRDVFFANIAPDRYIFDGLQRMATVDEPPIAGFGWYVEDVPAAFRECRRRGIRPVDRFEDPVEGDELPTISQFSLFFTARDSTGQRYTFFPEMELKLDVRTQAGWSLPPVAVDDPLGIIMSSHHTILTSRPERALAFVVDMLGGTVIHEGRNELLGATSTYVHLADAIIEYAVPDTGTSAYAAWARNIPNDTFYSVNWHVTDLERAEHHLRGHGVQILARSDDGFITDAATSLVPWGFFSARVPGDPRVLPAGV